MRNMFGIVENFGLYADMYQSQTNDGFSHDIDTIRGTRNDLAPDSH